jgi:hypothetical protein
MKEDFWEKIKKYKVFVILIILILILIIIKITSQNGQKNNSAITNSSTVGLNKNQVTSETITSTPIPTESKLSQEEVQKMSYEDFWNYSQTLTKEEQKKIPVMDFYVNSSLPHEESEFLAKKCEGGKIYAKAKIEDKVKASGALKYWYYIEIGTTLSNENIVWE